MVQCLSLSSSAATRLQSLLALVTTSTGLSTCQLVTSTIMYVVLTAMALYFWASSQYQRVRLSIWIFFFCPDPFDFTAVKAYADDARFRKFRQQLFHSSLAHILRRLKPGMTTPEVVRCPDSHFRRVVYGLGPYIADYPEQALLACIVQGWCPKHVFYVSYCDHY